MRNLFTVFMCVLMFASVAGAQIVATSIDNVPIGATTPSTGKFTNLEATGTLETTTLEATTNITLGGTTITGFSEIADEIFNSNVMLNTYRTAEINNLPILNIIDGAVDAFQFVTGVDAGASSNAFFEPGRNLYRPFPEDGTTIPAVNFDGTNDYLTISDATLGQSDGKSFTISFWQKAGVDATTENYITNTGSRFFVQKSGSEQVRVFFRNASGTVISDVKTTAQNLVEVADGWVHIFVAVDMANNTIQIAINGTVEPISVSTSPANDTIDFTNGEVGIAVAPPVSGGSVLFQGEIAHFYLTEEYIDPSVAGNLAKFIDIFGNPVDLGSDGSTPTGSQPRIFLNNTLSTWQNNLGSGGNFTEGGALTAGTDLFTSGDPSDMTLISQSQTAKTAPTRANILLLADGNIDLNASDLIASVSKDGGTIFTEVTTLEEVGNFEDGKLYTGAVDLPVGTGTNMEWKVETANDIDVQLHGVGLEWR